MFFCFSNSNTQSSNVDSRFEGILSLQDLSGDYHQPLISFPKNNSTKKHSDSGPCATNQQTAFEEASPENNLFHLNVVLLNERDTLLPKTQESDSFTRTACSNEKTEGPKDSSARALFSDWIKTDYFKSLTQRLEAAIAKQPFPVASRWLKRYYFSYLTQQRFWIPTKDFRPEHTSLPHEWLLNTAPYSLGIPSDYCYRYGDEWFSSLCCIELDEDPLLSTSQSNPGSNPLFIKRTLASVDYSSTATNSSEKSVQEDLSSLTRTPSPGFFPWIKRLYFSYANKSPPWLNSSDYASLGLEFAPDWVPESLLPILDLRGHAFTNRAFAWNVGVVGRYISKTPTFPQVIGLNCYWDCGEGRLANYNQLGIGMEVLGSRLETRANCYFPIGAKEKTHNSSWTYPGYYYVHKTYHEKILSFATNAEVGFYLLNHPILSLYLASGPYLFYGKSFPLTLGGTVRVRPQINDYLSVNITYSYDRLFQSHTQTEFIFSLPLYQIHKHHERKRSEDQTIYQRVERLDVIPIYKTVFWDTNY